MFRAATPKAFWISTSLLLAIPLAAMTGCSKGGGSSTGTAAAPNNAAMMAAGQRVFEANGCMRCHTVGGQGGGKGPDLTHVGADPQHTPQWLEEHVKNPRSQNPSSRMPAFEGRISENDLQALGAYLASLK
jgi:mono/diheme cytochrome c family protein